MSRDNAITRRSAIDQFISLRNLALAGASRSGKKFGNTVLKEMTKKGYAIVPVHPEAAEIGGFKCCPSLSDLPAPVEGLIIVVPPEQTEKIVTDAAARGIRNIWMQQGSESPKAVNTCREHGINEVHGECILMFAQPAGIHKFHRWIWGLLGKLPK
jgi:predicted CoA-binding protein